MVKSEPLRSGPVLHAIASDQAVAARGMHDLLVTDLRPELPKIGVPLKVLWARAPDSTLDESQLEAVYRSSFAAAPRAEITNIPDSYHFIMLDQPGPFAEQFRAVLAA